MKVDYKLNKTILMSNEKSHIFRVSQGIFSILVIIFSHLYVWSVYVTITLVVLGLKVL